VNTRTDLGALDGSQAPSATLTLPAKLDLAAYEDVLQGLTTAPAIFQNCEKMGRPTKLAGATALGAYGSKSVNAAASLSRPLAI
jgi:hypothetical protein